MVAEETMKTWRRRKTMLLIKEVNFSFANRKIIKLLTNRGNALKMALFDKADKIEEKIEKLKKEHYDDLTVPTRAFITFEHLVTAEMAQGMEFKLFEDEDKMVELTKPEYPSQILWEDTPHKPYISKTTQ
jgi:hypothetical protein